MPASRESGAPDSQAEPLPSYTRRPGLEVGPPRQLPRYSALYSGTDQPSPLSPTPTSGFSCVTPHEYHMKTTKGKPWATLSVISSASSPSNAPKFTTGQNVNGSVTFKLESADNINAVSISVSFFQIPRFQTNTDYTSVLQIRGTLITAANEAGFYTFLDREIGLWSKSMGDPRSTTPSSTKFNGKLSGEYQWPFSFPFPTEIPTPGSSESPAPLSSLPQTFKERNSGASVQYELLVHISRGMLKANSKYISFTSILHMIFLTAGSRIQTPIVYIPSSVPAPASPLRQRAYRTHSPLPSPQADPNGWFTLPPSTFSGKVFNMRTATVQCTVSYSPNLETKFINQYASISCHLQVL